METAASSASRISRRRFVTLAGATTLGGLLLPSFPASAATWERSEEAMAAIGDATPLTQGLLLEVPMVSENGASVPLTLRIDRPVGEDYPEAVHIIAPGNPDPEIAIFRFSPLAGRAEVATRIRLNESQRVIAVARMHSGDVLVAEREVRVTTSGCLMVDETYAAENIFQTRLRAPERLAAGEAGEVLSMINHPQETGLRTNASGYVLPQRIIERLEAEIDGETAFVAELKRSVSANPYVRFFVAPRESGTLSLRWTEDTGETVEATAEIAVA